MHVMHGNWKGTLSHIQILILAINYDQIVKNTTFNL